MGLSYKFKGIDMSLTKKSRLRKKFGIDEEQLSLAKDFLRRSVYERIQSCNYKNKVFALRDLVGGKNSDWGGSPLQCLYDKHWDKRKEKQSAIKEAGKEAGWILKNVISEDKQLFKQCNVGNRKGYIQADSMRNILHEPKGDSQDA